MLIFSKVNSQNSVENNSIPTVIYSHDYNITYQKQICKCGWISWDRCGDSHEENI